MKKVHRKLRTAPPSRKSTSWGRVAKWYEGAVDRDDSYQKTLFLPNLKRLLGVVTSKHILDLGCGTGFFAEELARAGANVVGVDLSPEFIETAQVHAREQKLSIRYHTGSADRLGMIADASMDFVLLILAIQNMAKGVEVIREVGRVLKKSGRLVMVVNHPAFRIPQHSAWGWDTEKRVQYRRADGYLLEKSITIQMHPGAKTREITTSFHRPLQWYVSALKSAGMCVSNLEEWISNKISDSGPRAEMENTARKEFPLFMYMEARKT